jgi:hypothetical protein
MMFEHITHDGVTLGHVATGTVAQQVDAVSQLHKVQDALITMQFDVLKHGAHIET